MKSETKKKNKYISKQKLTKTQLNNVRKEIQTICKEIGWIQFSTFEELADMLCLPNGDYIQLAVNELRKVEEILLQVWLRDMFISLIPNTWFYTRFIKEDIIEK
jgi:hypothetical protein